MTNCSVLKTQIIHIMRRIAVWKNHHYGRPKCQASIKRGKMGFRDAMQGFRFRDTSGFDRHAGAMMRSPLLMNQICDPLFVFLLVSLWTCSSCKTSPNVSFAYGAQRWTEPRDTGAFFVDTEEINIHSLMVSSANMPFALDKHDYIL